MRRRIIPFSLSVLLVASGAHAATSPWFGVWKLRLERPDQTAETLIYSDAGSGAMRMVSVEDKSLIVTHFDGQPAIDKGDGASRGWALAIKADGERSYRWPLLKEGAARAQGINTLAPDLKTFREVSSPLSHPERTVTMTYERQ